MTGNWIPRLFARVFLLMSCAALAAPAYAGGKITNGPPRSGSYLSFSGLFPVKGDIPGDPTFSYAEDGITISGGVPMERETGFTGAVGLWSQHRTFRAELEFGFHKASFDRVDNIRIRSGGTTSALDHIDLGGDLTTVSVMANMYVDTPLMGRGGPRGYAGVGVGTGLHKISYSGPASVTVDGTEHDLGTLASENDSAFAWQLLAGITWPLGNSVSMRLGYRWFASKPDFSGVSVDYSGHSVEAGLLLDF